ncbi:hypothetical protein RhiirB3_441811 [Rhizophagus irregularis]|nr:hypothetical protein RhiirB3_441811 [Rhizophagus irregularis]
MSLNYESSNYVNKITKTKCPQITRTKMSLNYENKNILKLNIRCTIMYKLEKGVDFRATLKVLELIWVSVGTCGLVIGEHIGLESDGSNNAKSVSHHFYHIENDPQLRAILYMVPSVKLASHGHFLAYDEALELFGVEFVKQNVTRIPTDKEKLKLKHN